MNVNSFPQTLMLIAVVMGISYLFGVTMNWLTGFKRK